MPLPLASFALSMERTYRGTAKHSNNEHSKDFKQSNFAEAQICWVAHGSQV